MQEEAKAKLSEIIERVNDLFSADTTDNDKLAWVIGWRGKLLQSQTLGEQAEHNTKQQFENSPDLDKLLVDALIDSGDSFGKLTTRALSSEALGKELKRIVLHQGMLYELLRDQRAAPLQA